MTAPQGDARIGVHVTQVEPAVAARFEVLEALSLPVVVCALGDPPLISFANAAARGLHGRGDLLELPVDVLSPDLPDAVRTVARDRASVRRRVQTGDGPWSVALDPVEGDDGGVTEVALTVLGRTAPPAAVDVRDAGRSAEGETLLRGALEISARLVDAPTPAAARTRLLQGLVEQLGLEAAALWVPEREGEGSDLALVGQAGLPEEPRRLLARLSAAEVADAAIGPPTGPATVLPSWAWPGHDVRLVAVPPPAGGLLGVYASTPLPPLLGGVLATLAHVLASAAHRTALHAQSRTVVDALQRELRPRAVDDLPAGLEVGWWYESATAGADVGGDFFDVFTTVQGAVGVVCGDVCGKGVEAASLTAMAVHGLRAYARGGAAPAEVLDRLNGMACERTADDRFLTLAYARLDPSSGRTLLTLAGHPPPVLVRSGMAELVGAAADLPVGIQEGAAYTGTELLLRPGDALVFYTDGVTEARCRGDQGGHLLGTEGLLAVLRGAGRADASALARAVWDRVQEHSAGGLSDDCAIVVLRRV